jgi:hypothetical protein
MSLKKSPNKNPKENLKKKIEKKIEDVIIEDEMISESEPIIRRYQRIGLDIFLIKRLDDESLDVYNKRIGYISQKIKNKKEDYDLDEIVNCSIIWRNHHIYKMGYPEQVLRKI